MMMNIAASELNFVVNDNALVRPSKFYAEG